MSQVRRTPIRQKQAHLLLSLPAITALVLAGCAGGGTSDTGDSENTIAITESLPAPEGQASTVTWGLYNEPASLDPIKPSDFPPQEVLANVCQSLLKIEPDMSFAPDLAVSWENPQPNVWVYQLRPDVQFHQGGTMTADDVVYSLKRAANYDLGSMVAGAYDEVKSIEATGPLEVTVTLNQADVTFHQEMATHSGRIVSQATTESQGDKVGTPGVNVDCTGPYELDEWSAGSGITIKKFDGYWDSENSARSDAIEFSFVRDAASRINGMLSGQIQGAWNVPASGFGQLSATDAGNLFFGESAGSLVGMVTSLDGGLKDQRVRQALSMVIDREGLVQAAAGGAAAPLYTVTSSGTWGYARDKFEAAADEIATETRSVEEAQKLIDAAGPQPTITIAATNAQSEMPIVAAEIQRAGQELGLDIEIKTLPEDTYNSLFGDEQAREGVDLMFSVWQASYPDPLSLYVYLQSENFYNYAKWENSEFDQLISTARETSDDDERAELIVQAQSIAMDDPTWIPIYQPFNPVFLGDGLTGIPTAAVQNNMPWAANLGTGVALPGN